MDKARGLVRGVAEAQVQNVEVQLVLRVRQRIVDTLGPFSGRRFRHRDRRGVTTAPGAGAGGGGFFWLSCHGCESAKAKNMQ